MVRVRLGRVRCMRYGVSRVREAAAQGVPLGLGCLCITAIPIPAHSCMSTVRTKRAMASG